MLPATAGRHLSEEEFRAFVRCSEFFFRGGKFNYSFELRVVRSCFERILVKYLKNEMKDPLRNLQACLLSAIAQENKKDHLLEPQLQRYMNSCILWIKDFFDLFPIHKYEPVYGAIEPQIIVSKTPITLHISGIFRSKKNQTIHVITFTPYKKRHSVLNDPVLPILLRLLQPFVKKHLQSRRPQIILHVFGIGSSNEVTYHKLTSNDVQKTTMNLIKSLVESLEAGTHYPILPCLYNCEFKSTCYPGISNA